jgi:ABC-type amino acid transport substrate-binding protein
MAQFIDGLLTKWLADGTWDKIYNQYLGKVEGLPKAADARAALPATAP